MSSSSIQRGNSKRQSRRAKRPTYFWLCGCVVALLVSACRQDMQDQPKYKPYRESAFFDDGQSARPLVEGTVPRGYLKEDARLYTGRVSGEQPPGSSTLRGYVDTFPFPITQNVIDRGQERFNIYCSPCHGRVGDGEGMVVKRGFRHPPSYHIDRLRNAPAGYFFDVITNGFGAMPDYSAQIGVRDRWAIIGYIRALQLSQRATLADVPPEGREQLGLEERK